MKNQKWYEISDLDDFVQNLRKLVLNSFFENEFEDKKDAFNDLFKTKKNELDKKLSLNEAYLIIKPMVQKSPNGTSGFIMSYKTFDKMIENLNRRIISNLLTELVASGEIESAFDSDQNDFIFWPKNSV